jgi:CRP-like cAMP-binding protein
MVARGAVEVLVSSRRLPEQTAAILEPGQFFGEIELMRGGNSLATIRAVENGSTELLVLPRADFMKMLSGSPLTEEAIGKIIQHRLAENQALAKKLK